MKNSAGRGGCYPPRPSALVDSNLQDLQNSSYPTKAEFNNCFIIHSKYFQTVKQRKSDGTKGVFEYICTFFFLISAPVKLL